MIGGGYGFEGLEEVIGGGYGLRQGRSDRWRIRGEGGGKVIGIKL